MPQLGVILCYIETLSVRPLQGMMNVYKQKGRVSYALLCQLIFLPQPQIKKYYEINQHALDSRRIIQLTRDLSSTKGELSKMWAQSLFKSSNES